MSRTRKLSIKIKMENNNNFSSLLGLNACSLDDTGACFQYLVNKSFENGKQYIKNDVNTVSEINNSLLNTLNVIDTNIKNSNTYTLDDLLDLGNEELNSASLFDGSLENEALFFPTATENGFVSTEILMETAMASPLSSSSEESYDLDEILFMNEVPLNGNAVQEAVIDKSSNMVLLDSLTAMDDVTTSKALSSLEDGTDFSALCSLLFQNQAISIPSQQDISPDVTEPNSPASSESETEDVRYKPYKKPKSTEQKLRKKSQNRTAATRYRVKKKDELKIMSLEADELEGKNKDLRGKVDGLRTEIDYLKNLMLDVIKARLAKGTLPESLLSVVMAK